MEGNFCEERGNAQHLLGMRLWWRATGKRPRTGKGIRGSIAAVIHLRLPWCSDSSRLGAQPKL